MVFRVIRHIRFPQRNPFYIVHNNITCECTHIFEYVSISAAERSSAFDKTWNITQNEKIQLLYRICSLLHVCNLFITVERMPAKFQIR